MKLDENQNIGGLDQIAQADSAYRPIVPFTEWQATHVDETRWEQQKALLNKHGQLAPEQLSRARDVAKRAAAIDTGALEGLYELDRGVTITIATQAAMWEAAYQKEQERVRQLIECQLDAYDFVIDFATQSIPIAEAWIRALHTKLCSAQKTYKAFTAVGIQDQELAHGAYKTYPNHVRKSDNTLHSYAPVAQTGPEMQRLCDQIRTTEFERAHPVIQAAYTHHALTCIHPFQDGNGRVARAFASIFLYRAASIPLLVLVEHRGEYLDALEAADENNFKAFTDFVLARSIDAFILVNESLRAALLPSPSEAAEDLRKLLYTRGGYLHQEVDVAGKNLLAMFEEEFRKQMVPYNIANELAISVSRIVANYPGQKPGYRNPVGVSHENVQCNFRAASPATEMVSLNFYFQVPRDCDTHDAICVRCRENDLEFASPISNVLGTSKTVVKLQLAMFVQTVLSGSLVRLRSISEKEIRGMGY